MIPDRLLGDGEWVELATRPHWRRTVKPTLAVILIAPTTAYLAGRVPESNVQTLVRLAVAGLALVLLSLVALAPFLGWLTTSYTVTNRRLIVRQGLIGRSGRDMPLSRLNDVSFSQHGLLDRLLRCGSLVVESAGERGQLVLRDVPSVQEMGREIYRLADADAERLRWGRDRPAGPEDRYP